jgi:hypothetical protein
MIQEASSSYQDAGSSDVIARYVDRGRHSGVDRDELSHFLIRLHSLLRQLDPGGK